MGNRMDHIEQQVAVLNQAQAPQVQGHGQALHQPPPVALLPPPGQPPIRDNPEPAMMDFTVNGGGDGVDANHDMPILEADREKTPVPEVEWPVGSKVEVLWQTGVRLRWYPGTVVGVDGDIRQVDYDDNERRWYQYRIVNKSKWRDLEKGSTTDVRRPTPRRAAARCNRNNAEQAAERAPMQRRVWARPLQNHRKPWGGTPELAKIQETVQNGRQHINSSKHYMKGMNFTVISNKLAREIKTRSRSAVQTRLRYEADLEYGKGKWRVGPYVKAKRGKGRIMPY